MSDNRKVQARQEGEMEGRLQRAQVQDRITAANPLCIMCMSIQIVSMSGTVQHSNTEKTKSTPLHAVDAKWCCCEQISSRFIMVTMEMTPT